MTTKTEKLKAAHTAADTLTRAALLALYNESIDLGLHHRERETDTTITIDTGDIYKGAYFDCYYIESLAAIAFWQSDEEVAAMALEDVRTLFADYYTLIDIAEHEKVLLARREELTDEYLAADAEDAA